LRPSLPLAAISPKRLTSLRKKLTAISKLCLAASSLC
jgi:hypothetical protein